MKHIRLLSLLLAVCMLSAAFCACGDTSSPEVTDAVTTAAEAVPTEAETEETRDPDYVCELPDSLNFKDNPNNTIRMMVDAYKYSKDELFAEEENGNIINSAVIKRNALVEEKLGVTLAITRAESTSDTEVANAVSKAVSAGDKTYDICTIPGYRATQYLKGNFHNLVGVENLNLDKHYWTQGFNEIMRIGDKQFLSSGAYSLSMIRGMYVTAFNKDLLENFHMESPYDLVAKDEWTFEKHAQMVKDVYVDDGNNVRDDADTYGFIGGSYSTTDPYWVSFHMKFLVQKDGEYAVEVEEEKFSNIITMVHGLLFDNTGAFCLATGSAVPNGTATAVEIGNKFCNNQAATAVMEINVIEQQVVMGGFAGRFGIVPIPKYNADQEAYYTHTSDRLTNMAIVSTVSTEDLPMMGAVMEEIAYESYEHVFPVYYENALTFRFLQDTESKKMLDMIYDGIRIEGAFLYSGYFSMLSGFRSMFASGEASASLVKSSKTSWAAKVKLLNKDIAKY